MAFTFTGRNLTPYAFWGSSTTSGDISSTFTPSEDDLIVVAVSFFSGDGTVTSVTGHGSTAFSQIASHSGSTQDVEVWAGRMPASPGSDAISMVTSSHSFFTHFVVYQISGAKTDGTVASIFDQTVSDDQYGSAITSEWDLPSFASSPASDSATLVAWSFRALWTMTLPTGYEEIIVSDQVYPDGCVGMHWYDGADDPPAVAFSAKGNYTAVSGIGLEILADGGGGGGGSIVPIVLSHDHFNGGL